MDGVVTWILSLVLALQVKHVICDGPLQSLAMVHSKQKYGDGLGLAHGLIHGLGSLPLLLLWGAPLAWAVLLCAVEAIIHYHIDFVKEWSNRVFRLKPEGGPFWWAFTTDQALHHMCYVGLAYLALKP